MRACKNIVPKGGAVVGIQDSRPGLFGALASVMAWVTGGLIIRNALVFCMAILAITVDALNEEKNATD